MPLFEYICRDCRHQFETLVTAERRPACPTCHGTALDKQLSAFAVGASQDRPAESASMAGACGTCGDPRGPGACSLN